MGFGVIAFHAITDGDLPLAIRLASGMAVVRWAFAASPKNMTGPAWDGIGRGQWWFSMSFVGLLVGVWGVSLLSGRCRSFN